MKRILSLLLLLSPGVCRAQLAQPTYCGFILWTWGSDPYKKGDPEASLKTMSDMGAQTVAIHPTWFMKDVKSSSVERGDATPSDDSMRQIMRSAHGHNLKVVLKPHVDVSDGSFRGVITPDDKAAWFRSYHDFMMSYAHMANDEGADMLIIGTELSTMQGPDYTDKWESLIKDIKTVYGGLLSYGSNFDAYKTVGFWKSLDFVGIDAYFPLLKGPSVDQLKDGWQEHLPGIREVAAASGRPVLFTEVGLPSRTGAEQASWDTSIQGNVDVQLQSDYFQAFLEVFEKEPYFAGFLQWAWDVDPSVGGPQDGGYSVQKKPAQNILKIYFQSLKEPVPEPVDPGNPNFPDPQALQQIPSFDANGL
jgi:hypothetical protein